MFYLPKIKILKSILSISLATLSFCNLSSYADTANNISVDSLVAGYGKIAIDANTMNTAPVNDNLTIAINNAQATYLLSPTSPLVSPLTQKLLTQSANLDDNNNNIIAFTWNPDGKKTNSNVEKKPLQSIDINSLLQPLSYNETQAIEATNVINALNSSLAPINTVNFNQLVANLNGNKRSNLNVKLNEKPIKEYLASLRSYLATQSIALSNLYQLYAERQPLDPNDPAVRQLPGEIKGSYSLLKLENFMATRRILDKNWYASDLIKENPATLQRQQVELLAENLAESYHTRMTLERLLATMSVLVLELNNQGRAQLIQQAQNINNPNSTSG
ncbi:MAG: hypothetical protein E6K54_04520 [Gammaproteobacteria bacterium]|nr:MAG: hypothetical protein E6K54_04520 [Gammaproteobacteria bacterium]